MLRQRDVEDLLIEINDNISVIHLQIKNAEDDSSIISLLKPKVKNCLEHLRSCLDFCAKDIYDVVLRPNIGNRNKAYFPYGKTKEDFRSSIKRNGFLLLKSYNKKIYHLVESIQPHVLKKEWLYELCAYTNENKHDRLTTQERLDGLAIKSGKGNIIKVCNKSTVVIQNSILDGKYVEKVILDKGRIIADSKFYELGLSIVDWTDFRFEDSGISILGLIEESYNNIFSFQSELYELLQEIKEEAR